MPSQRYWIALNGSSVARSDFAMTTPTVIPTPQVLIGFLDEAEAKKTQTFLLKAPIGEVRARVRKLMRRPDLEVHEYDAEPQTQGQTMWLQGGDDEIAAALRVARAATEGSK
jgi:hypothetical protein